MARAGSTHFSDRVNQAFDGYPIVAMVPALPLENLGSHKITGDFTFLDKEQTVVAELKGYEAVADEALTRAFQNKTL